MAMDTGHVTLPQGQLKNLRLDVMFDDGTQLAFEDNKRYQVQNIGGDDVKICQRATSRGEPDLDSNDALLLGHKEDAWIDVEANANYFAWSVGKDSILAVGEVVK